MSETDKPGNEPENEPVENRASLFSSQTTTGRIVETVPQPAQNLLKVKEIYKKSKNPNHEILREHLRKEGRLTNEAALKIINQGLIFGEFRFLNKIFSFWPKLRFLHKIFSFWPNLAQITIFDQIVIFGPNYDFCVSNCVFLAKLSFFWPKF